MSYFEDKFGQQILTASEDSKAFNTALLDVLTRTVVEIIKRLPNDKADEITGLLEGTYKAMDEINSQMGKDADIEQLSHAQAQAAEWLLKIIKQPAPALIQQ